MKKKIGILTLPFDPNYGWILQLWAMCHFLLNKGYDVEVIDRRWDDKSPSIIKKIERWVYYHVFCRNFFQFYNREFKRTREIRSYSVMLSNFNDKHYDAVIVGSDQVWRIEHTRGVGLNFYLDFLQDKKNVKRISYAAYFGKDNWNGTSEEKQSVSQLLKDFDLITVREESGIGICKELFNVEAHHVLDPTMLLRIEDYNAIILNKKECNHKIVTYILDYTARKDEIVKIVASILKKDIKHLYTKKKRLFSFYTSVGKWLYSIKDAEFVLVDSFHGMVFSILFRKQFIVVGNKARGMARFESLLEQLGLENRLINEDCPNNDVIEILHTPINYDNIFNSINKLRSKSEALLINTIES